MISKKLFFVWCGKSLSWLRATSIISFKKFNPDWDVSLHVLPFINIKSNSINKQDFELYDGKDYTRLVEKSGVRIRYISDINININSMSPVHKTDAYRWEVLSSEGGFYSDTDILYCNSIKKLYSEVQNKHTLICFNVMGWILIGFVGCCENNKFYRCILGQSLQNYSSEKYQSCGADTVYNVMFWASGTTNKRILRALLSKKYRFGAFPDEEVYNVKEHLIYPVSYRKVELLLQEGKKLRPEIGVHWFGGQKKTQQFNLYINELNYMQVDNPLTDMCKKVYSD
jgi:hypothetical protein